jgi:hypothetical protein
MPYRRHRRFEVSYAARFARELSCIALIDFATCQLRYWLRYVEGWRKESHVGSEGLLSRPEFGRFVHAIVADLFREPPDKRSKVLVGSLVRNRWPSYLRHAIGYKQMNRAIDYVEQIWDLMSPGRANVVAGGIEKQVETTVEGRSLRGRIDLVMSGKEGRPILVDFKTGSQVEFPEGELYPDVMSRNVSHLPILSLVTDDDFFQLRTYDYILGEVELSQKGERQLALIHLAQAKLRTIDIGD